MNKTSTFYKTLLFFIFLIPFTAISQMPQLQKLSFLIGKYNVQAGKGEVEASWDASKKVIKWKYESPQKKSSANIIFSEKINAYELTEFEKGLVITYYRGYPSTTGVHFFELSTMNGIMKDDGKEIILQPGAHRMVEMVRKEKVAYDKNCKGAFTSIYYPTYSVAEEKAVQKDAIVKLKPFTGKFTEDARQGNVEGSYSVDGTSYSWDYKGVSNTSKTKITYDYKTGMYFLEETIGFNSGSKGSTDSYEGYIKDGKLVTYTMDENVKGLNLSIDKNGRLVMERTDAVQVIYTGTYSPAK